MANNEQLELAEAVRLTLAYGGAEIFANPQEFLRYLTDMTDNRSHEMRVLLHNCDEALLAPFRQADSMSARDLRVAAHQAQDHLVDECQINEVTARVVAQGIAQGVARWRGIALSFDEGSRQAGGISAGTQPQKKRQKKKRSLKTWLVAFLAIGAFGAAVGLASAHGWGPWATGDRGGGAVITTGSGPSSGDEEPEEQGTWVTTGYETTLPNGYVSDRSVTEYDNQGNKTYYVYEWSDEDGDVHQSETTYGGYDQYGYPAWSKMESKTTEPGNTVSYRSEWSTSYTNEIDTLGRLLSENTHETTRSWFASSGTWDDGDSFDTTTTYTYRGEVMIRSVWTSKRDDSNSMSVSEYNEHGHRTRYEYNYDGGSEYRSSIVEGCSYVYATGDKLRSSRELRTETDFDGTKTITTFERTYDANGFLSKQVETVDGQTTITEYENECDEHGNLVRQENLTDGSVTTFTYRYIENPSVAVLNGWG